MEHGNELKEALDFVSPSALTYDEWLMVGMALKDSGLPVTLWEQWSTRDAGRYHKGECVTKRSWKVLRRRGQPRHRKQHLPAGLLPRMERPGGPRSGLER